MMEEGHSGGGRRPRRRSASPTPHHPAPRPHSLTRTSVSIDTSRAKSNGEVVRMCAEQFGWKDYPEGRKDGGKCDIYWTNVVYSDMKETVPGGCKVNKFPGMNELSKKISLTRALDSMQKLYPHEFDFVPKSWFIPAQLDNFYEDYYSMLEQKAGRLPWFIVKPDEGAQGCGIYLIHNPEQLQNLDQPQLIQEYLAEPFLLQDNLKFDFRVYAVIRSINPLSIYVAREGMARFCTQKYRMPSVSNSDQVFMHLTNYSLNKTNQDYVHSNTLSNQGSKRLLSTVFHQMDARGINTRKIWHNIKLIVVKTVLAMVPEIILNYENHFSNGTTALQGPHCFHILGFDIILTKDLTPILLEINACPSLSIGHDALEKEEEGEKVQSVVDEAIKVPLVRDTLLVLMNQLPNKNERMVDSASSTRTLHSVDDSEPPYHGKPSLREVFPGRYGHLCGHFLILDKAAYLYMQFINVRRTLNITMSGCRTFVKKCHLSEFVPTAEVDLLYCKIQKNWQGQSASGVPFHGFLQLLMEISLVKYPEAENLLEGFQALLHYCQTKLRHSGVRSARLRNETVATPDDEDGAKQIYLLPNRLPKKRNESAGRSGKLSGNANSNSENNRQMANGGTNGKTKPVIGGFSGPGVRNRTGSGGVVFRHKFSDSSNVTLPKLV